MDGKERRTSMDGAYAENCLEQFQRMSYGWTAVITFWRKEPWMAVRLCPWMDGISQGAMDGEIGRASRRERVFSAVS